MAALLKKNLDILGYFKIILLFLGCLLFYISDRGIDISYEQHILMSAADHYCLLFFVFPITLLIFFQFLEDDDGNVILRFRNYWQYFVKKWISMSFLCACIVTTQYLAILLSGMGLPLHNDWNIAKSLTPLVGDVFAHLEMYFHTPLQAIFVLIIWQWIGSLIIMGMLMWLSHFIKKRTYVIAIVMALYLISALWLKIPFLQKIPFSSLNHYIIFHHNLLDENRLLTTVCTEILLIVGILLSVKYCWRKSFSVTKKRRGILIGYYVRTLITRKKILIMTIVFAILTIFQALNGNGIFSMVDWFVQCFAGHGVSNFRLISFLEMLIMNGVPLYFMSMFLEGTINKQFDFVIIRALKRENIIFSHLLLGIIFLLIYSFVMFPISIAGGMILGLEFSFNAIKSLIMILGLKFLDQFFQYLFLLAIYYCTSSVTIGFISLLFGNLLCVFPQAFSKWVPFGISSVARFYNLTIECSDIVNKSIYLVMLSFTFVLGVLFIGKRRQNFIK